MKELKSVGLHMQSNSFYIIPHVTPNLNGLISISIECQVICYSCNILHFHWSIIFNLHCITFTAHHFRLIRVAYVVLDQLFFRL